MKTIASYKNGNYYYIENLNSILECFADALGWLKSIIGLILLNIYLNLAKNVKLTFKLDKPSILNDMRVS